MVAQKMLKEHMFVTIDADGIGPEQDHGLLHQTQNKDLPIIAIVENGSDLDRQAKEEPLKDVKRKKAIHHVTTDRLPPAEEAPGRLVQTLTPWRPSSGPSLHRQ